MAQRLIFALILLSVGCSSAPESDRPTPGWVTQPTRTVDNGYIVYVGSGEETDRGNAELAAEGAALQDLANECSFVPKGTRVEDKFVQTLKNTHKAYAKIAVEFQLCTEASKQTDPLEIKKLANVSFTEELKRYEDNIQDHRDEVVEADISDKDLAAPSEGTIRNDTHFFMVRQYVVYQNQAVILSPATAYQPGSPESVAYTNHVSPIVRVVQTYSSQHPEIIKNPPTWSKVAPQARSEKPQSFSSQAGKSAKAVTAPGPRNSGRSMRPGGRVRPPAAPPQGLPGPRRRRGYPYPTN